MDGFKEERFTNKTLSDKKTPRLLKRWREFRSNNHKFRFRGAISVSTARVWFQQQELPFQQRQVRFNTVNVRSNNARPVSTSRMFVSTARMSFQQRWLHSNGSSFWAKLALVGKICRAWFTTPVNICDLVNHALHD
jgi:hypothetical protein